MIVSREIADKDRTIGDNGFETWLTGEVLRVGNLNLQDLVIERNGDFKEGSVVIAPRSDGSQSVGIVYKVDFSVNYAKVYYWYSKYDTIGHKDILIKNLSLVK